MQDNDQNASRLISESLRTTLSRQDSEKLQQHMKENEQSRQFAELSELIQNSVRHAAEKAADANDASAPGLSAEAKERMKSSVRTATEEVNSLSRSGLIETNVDVHSTSRSHRSSLYLANEKSEKDDRQVVSNFRLIRRLGEGGLGNVWLARDEKLNRNVAIKEMRPQALESEKSWTRFHREAEITGHLEHPNVVPLYQFGEDRKTGEPFYAMRFVGKRTLADAIEEHHDRVEAGQDPTLGLHRLLSVFLDVCQAIAYAHSRGVVHRDLKPENVALDNFGQVIVLDWGLAKLNEDGELFHQLSWQSELSDFSLSKTMEGDVVGTPLYMAPEQAAGLLDKVDDKTDVYGLGAILFAILTGSAPHEKKASPDSPAADLSGILKMIANDDSPRVRELRSGVSSELESICSTAMAKKRHLRFDSVQDLADSVERWMAGQSEKQARYENLRMEGRELRADLKSSVENLERNVRFMSHLPPIQQLIVADSDEDINVWRERLATIFSGLLQANPDYRNVAYCRIDGEEFTELVRVERHSKESNNIRIVPRSRLRTEKVNELILKVVEQKPEEVLTSLVSDPLCEESGTCDGKVALAAGVPVYDQKTEEPFGVILIDCDIDQVIRRQMNKRLFAGEIVVACDKFHIMMHYKDGEIVAENQYSPLANIATDFVPASEHLWNNLEFIDDADAEIYGARIWFIPNKHGLMYLLRREK